MIVRPERHIEKFISSGSDVITVHYEATPNLFLTIRKIKERGKKAGVAINPHTPVTSLTDILPYIDQVLIMSVNPGAGGQEFIHTSLRKVSQMRDLIEKTGLKILIEIDGGINSENIQEVINAGADLIVVGNAIFSHKDYLSTLRKFLHTVREKAGNPVRPSGINE